MGGGSPSPSPVGSPHGNITEGDLANALNNLGIQPSVPGPSAMPTSFGAHPPRSGSSPPGPQHHKHRVKCYLKMKHRHPEHRHGGRKEKHRSPHCHHGNKHMNIEAPLGEAFHCHGPHPPPRPHPHPHHMKQKHHGYCCLHGHYDFFTHPICVPPPHN